MPGKLGRTTEQRLAILRNQASQLLWYGKIETTLEKAKDALFNQLYQVGIFSEAQKLDYIQALCLDYYCGKDRVLFDTIRSIENSVGIIEQKIRQKRYSYLLEYSKKQRNKGFEILY